MTANTAGTSIHPQNSAGHTYPPESAGRLMAPNIPAVQADATIADIERMLVRDAGDFDSISYVYVVDAAERLCGVMSIKDIYRSQQEATVGDLMVRDPKAVRPHTDQEHVALLALKHNIKAVPVIDKDGKLLGIVDSDAILNILHSESVEDALRMAGSGTFDDPAVGIIHAGAWTHFKKRLPWLALGLLGGVIAVFIVRFFEDALKEELLLAAFIPAVVYMADAVGAQTQTIFIRSLALAHELNVRRYVWREVKVTVSLALLLGAASFVFAFVFLSSMALGVVLGIAISLTIFAAMVVGLMLPLMLERLNFDPAIASGPFATVIRDVMSLLIYFSVAMLLL